MIFTNSKQRVPTKLYIRLLLNILAKEGIGGIIAPQHKMPSMFIFSGTLIGSRDFGGVEISLNGGLDLGLSFWRARSNL